MIENQFSVPIFNRILADADTDLIQDEIAKNLDSIRSHVKSPWMDLVRTTFDYSEDQVNIIKKYKLNHLEKTIVKNLSIVFNLQSSDNIYIRHCWMNFNGPGEFQFDHDHLGAWLSGVYYYKTNTNDGNILFTNPNPHIQNFYEIEPAVGRLIMFPSYLKHRVAPNKTQDERISISFNIDVVPGTKID